MTVTRLLGVAVLVSIATADVWLNDHCHYKPMHGWRLGKIDEPAYVIKRYHGDPWKSNPKECFQACCSTENQEDGYNCTAATTLYDVQGVFICKLLHCVGDKCLWYPSSDEKHVSAVFGSGDKPAAKTSKATELLTPPAVNTTENSTQPTHYNVTESVTQTPNVTNETLVTEMTHDNLTTATNVTNTTSGKYGHASHAKSSTESTTKSPGSTTKSTSKAHQQQPNHVPDWSWYQRPEEPKPESRPKKPEVNRVLPRPANKKYRVPTKGLVAGIVLAVLVLLVLMSFLVKQLRGKKHPVYYKPLREEEYQKLTVGEA